MKEVELTLKELNAHVDKYFKPNQNAKPMTKKLAEAELCGIYKAVKPILEKVLKFPFLSDKFKKVLSAFIEVLNIFCIK